MNNIKDMIDEMLGIENIDEIKFKSIELNHDKNIYFIFHKNQKIVKGRLTSGSIAPVAFILKMGGEYYYCPLNNKEFDENLVKEFSKRYQ